MAASATLHAAVAGLVPSRGFRSRRAGLSSTVLLPNQRIVRVRCQADEEIKPQQPPATVTPPSPAAQAPPPQPQPKAIKTSTKFSDVLAFSGPAPERINGRLAMIGFVSAMAVEVARGDDLFVQLANGGMPWFVGTAALLSAASLVPLFKGVSAQSKSGGLMTADAELWNGRFAMLGLVALAFTEYLKGGPLV